jgi:outer membrane protein TolC
MKYKLLFIFLLTAACITAQDGKIISVDDCVRIGIENNKNLQVSLSKLYSVRQRLKEVKTNELPALRLNGSYSRLSEVDPFVIMGQQIQPAILNNTNFRLTLSQPLFTGFRLSSNTEAAEYNVFASERDYTRDVNLLTYDIRNAYWSYVKAYELKKTIEKNIEQVRTRLRDLVNQYEAGLATNNDVLKVRVQLSNFEILLLEAGNSMDIGILSLNNLMGIPVSTKIQPKVENVYQTVYLPALDSLTTQAFVNRSELKSLEMKIKSSESGINSAKSGWYPQLNLAANYIYANPNSRIFPSQAAFKGTWDVGITLSYDIWNWRLTSYQTAQAKATRDQNTLAFELTKNNIELEVAQVYKNLQNTIERFRLTKETVEQAKENYRVTNEKFRSGLVLNLEVVDAETSLLLAEINYTTTIIDYFIGVAKLEKATEQKIK